MSSPWEAQLDVCSVYHIRWYSGSSKPVYPSKVISRYAVHNPAIKISFLPRIFRLDTCIFLRPTNMENPKRPRLETAPQTQKGALELAEKAIQECLASKDSPQRYRYMLCCISSTGFMLPGLMQCSSNILDSV